MNILFFRSKKILKKSIGTKLFSFGLALIIFSGIHWYFEASVALAKNEAQTSASSIEFQQIALMPFIKGSFESPDGPVDKPLSRQLSQITLEKQYLREDADQVLTRLIAKALETRFGEKLVPVEKALSVFEHISEDNSLDTPRKLAKAFGDQLQAELVVVGSVWRYHDRDSVKDMQDFQASVAFELYLVESATGQRLWRGKFSETQKALTDDVIRGFKQLKMGARWLTADELARYGVKEVFKRFPIRE
jgi:hypothetical protein